MLFPEIDIRQRLTLQSGYGVVEVPIDDRSELCGKTIDGAALRERDVIVLTIQRGSITIPNPKTSREILPATCCCASARRSRSSRSRRGASASASGSRAMSAATRAPAD